MGGLARFLPKSRHSDEQVTRHRAATEINNARRSCNAEERPLEGSARAQGVKMVHDQLVDILDANNFYCEKHCVMH